MSRWSPAAITEGRRPVQRPFWNRESPGWSSGSRDPNPLVAGNGAAMLRANGVLVEEDFLREECDSINPVFFHYITTGKPYVVMKYAMTLDGKIATYTGASKWITGEAARQHVHQLRGRYRAILAGIGTVLAMIQCSTVDFWLSAACADHCG